ncbi:MAG: MFS transporter, partial [Acidimicrobiia bacterium]
MRELFRIPAYAVVWVVGFFQGIGFFLLVNVPGRILELGLTEGSIGLVYSVAAFAGLAIRPLLGRTLDVVRRRTVIRIAGFINVAAVLGLALTAVAGPGLYGWFVLARASQIAIFTATLTYAADSLPTELRTRGLAIFGLSGLIPIAVSNLVGDRIIAAAT